MLRSCNGHIQEAIAAARELTALANKLDEVRDDSDDGCGVLAGVMRDCGYRIQTVACRQLQAHRAREARATCDTPKAP